MGDTQVWFMERLGKKKPKNNKRNSAKLSRQTKSFSGMEVTSETNKIPTTTTTTTTTRTATTSVVIGTTRHHGRPLRWARDTNKDRPRSRSRRRRRILLTCVTILPLIGILGLPELSSALLLPTNPTCRTFPSPYDVTGRRRHTQQRPPTTRNIHDRVTSHHKVHLSSRETRSTLFFRKHTMDLQSLFGPPRHVGQPDHISFGTIRHSSQRTKRHLLPLDTLMDAATGTVLHDALSASLILAKSNIGALDPFAQLPFEDLGSELTKSLDIHLFGPEGTDLSDIPQEETELVLGSLGQDILIFLTASVLVSVVSNFVGVTPILGYLFIGALLGPNALSLYSNPQADVDIGDFGIMFLLFSEGLEVTKNRLQKLALYLPLGAAQIAMTSAAITAALLVAGYELPINDNAFLDVTDPIQAVIIAIAAALSTSAFVFPALKEKGWEEDKSGEAATTTLLLQDLLIAPLLVFLPYLVSEGPIDISAVGFLTAKATIGFGSVVVAGSFFLSWLFALVAGTGSSETFVALCLLVAAGMGQIAQSLGLTDTAGAFAAGVLLANTNYRAQIQADILPFKTILLGIFFMDAGSTFDLSLVTQEWPTVVGGSIFLLTIKALVMLLATLTPSQALEPNKLPLVDAIRVSVLLSGGGEFAFVVLASAEKLGIIDDYSLKMLTAIILVSMGITPILGNVASALSQPFVSEDDETTPMANNEKKGGMTIAKNAVVVCGHAESGRAVVRTLSERFASSSVSGMNSGETNVVAFCRDRCLSDSMQEEPGRQSIVLYGDGSNPEVIRLSGVTEPRAIFVAYEDHSKCLSATARLRASFEDTPIFCRAATRSEAQNLEFAGATETVVESDELAKAVPLLLRGEWDSDLNENEDEIDEEFRVAASTAADIPLKTVDELFELFRSLDTDASGLLQHDELLDLFRKTRKGFVASDEEIESMERWLEGTTWSESDPMDRIEFCRLYARAPAFVKESFGNLRSIPENQEEQDSRTTSLS